jgi:excisionase family DNA binding protein
VQPNPITPPPSVLDAALEAVVERCLERVLRRHFERPATDADWTDGKTIAAWLGVKPRSITKMITHQGLPAHRVGAKLWRFRRSEVEQWLTGRR